MISARAYLLSTVTALLVLAGCSATNLVYDNLPWLLRQRIDAHFDLTSAQSSQLKMHIAEVADWHRREELPRYASALGELETALADGLTKAELERFVAEVKAARSRLLGRVIPVSVEFLHTVNVEQIAEFEQSYRDDLEEDLERLALTREEQLELRYERTLESLEDWFGDFDRAQRKRIRELSEALPDTYASWLKRREFQHQRFVKLLRDRPPKAAIEQRLTEWWLSEDAALPADLLAGRTLFWNSALAFMLDVDGLLSAEQRARAISRISGYREDFLRLSRAVYPQRREARI